MVQKVGSFSFSSCGYERSFGAPCCVFSKLRASSGSCCIFPELHYIAYEMNNNRIQELVFVHCVGFLLGEPTHSNSPLDFHNVDYCKSVQLDNNEWLTWRFLIGNAIVVLWGTNWQWAELNVVCSNCLS